MTKFRVESRDRDIFFSRLPLLSLGAESKKPLLAIWSSFVCFDLTMEFLAFTRLCLHTAVKEGKKRRWQKMVTKMGRGENPVGYKWKKQQRMLRGKSKKWVGNDTTLELEWWCCWNWRFSTKLFHWYGHGSSTNLGWHWGWRVWADLRKEGTDQSR